MDSFVMEIAGLAVHVQPMFLSTKEYCKAYLTEEEAEIFVNVTPEDLVYEQKLADIEADEEGLKRRKFTDPFLERATIQRKIANALLHRNVLMVHGSTVALDGQAYMFTAACGTGKSTHTRLWREVFGDRAAMVNDDKPFLALTEAGVIAHGSPWTGKHGLGSNISVPLKGICILHRGPENVIRPLQPEEAMAMLLHQTHIPDADSALAEDLVTRLAKSVPLWEMECTKEPEAGLTSFRAMSAGI